MSQAVAYPLRRCRAFLLTEACESRPYCRMRVVGTDCISGYGKGRCRRGVGGEGLQECCDEYASHRYGYGPEGCHYCLCASSEKRYGKAFDFSM